MDRAKTARPILPQHDAEDLTQGGQQAKICLGEQVYTLRITKQHKLLLTK
ncbi:MAG: hemin uptake protein HemP [Pseudomonadota bacterium]